MNLYYKIKNEIREAKYILKRKCQRFKHGYAYGDVWNMDYWFIETVKPMLVHLKEHGCSYPMEFKDRDEWCAVIDEMVNCIELMDETNAFSYLGFNEFEDYMRMTTDDYKKKYELMEENKNRFFELFSKHFYDLWD